MSASVEYHMELAKDHSKTKGGGWWELEGNNLYLYSESNDFGAAKIEDIKSALEEDITSMRVEGWNVYFSNCHSLKEAKATGILIKNANTQE